MFSQELLGSLFKKKLNESLSSKGDLCQASLKYWPIVSWEEDDENVQRLATRNSAQVS